MTVENSDAQSVVCEPQCGRRAAINTLLAGTIASADRRELVSHIARCASCREVYLAGEQMQLPARRGRSRFLKFVAVVVLIAAAATGYQLSRRTAGVSLSSLAEAMRPDAYRVIEARIAGGFDFKPYRRPQNQDSDVRLRTGGFETTQDPHVNGVVLLLNARLDQAVETLDRAAGGPRESGDYDDVTSSEVLSSLAAARYERGVRQGRPVDLAHAFCAASRAIELAPRQAEAHFTRALALQALSLHDDAAQAWREYLAIDSTSGWADEARSHLAQLSGREIRIDNVTMRAAAMKANVQELGELVRRAPLIARMVAEDELLNEWGVASAAGQADHAATALRAARAIGEALSSAGGDRTVADAVKDIDAADGKQSALLAAGYRAFGAARRAFAVRRDAAAREALVTAAETMQHADSPLAARAYVYAGTVAYYEGTNDQALRLVESATTLIRTREDGWPVVAGQALWLRGQVDFARGFPHRAINAYLAARRYFIRARERPNVSGVETMLAACTRYIGDPDEAWAHYLQSLVFLDGTAPYSRRQVAFADAAKAATLAGHLRLAEVLTARVALNAQREGDYIFTAQSLYARGRIAIARTRFQEAADLLARADGLLASNPPTASTTRLVGDVAAARGEALSRINPRDAIRFLDEALLRHRRHGALLRLPEVYLLAGAAHVQLGDPTAAEREFRAGIEELERQRLQLRSDEERSTFTDTGRRLYDETIQLLIARGATDDALRIARGARTIGLTSAGSLISTHTRANQMPLDPEMASVEYYVLADKLLIWTTVAHERRFATRKISKAQLIEAIERSTERLSSCSRTSDCTGDASELFELLLRPAADAIRGRQDVVIAPDGVLHAVPFAALFDRRTGEFVVQQHALSIALGGLPAADPGHYRSIVAVVPDAGPGEPQLLHARAEARRAAASFAAVTIVEGAEATAERLLEEAPRHEVVHFAGHARWNDRQPRFASLQLSPTGNRSDGSLYAHEMNDRRFDKTKLVVLAGCDTARGRRSGVGLLSFARTFTAAGVPRVVGSLWPVDDAASAELFARFYPELARGATPERALSNAQRILLESNGDNGPALWAAYQIYSGNERKDGGSR